LPVAEFGASRVTELESRSLVERSGDPEHKRRNIVTITAEGLEQLIELDKVIDGVQEEFLPPLTAAQRRQFITLMSRLVDADRSRGAARPGRAVGPVQRPRPSKAFSA
jgi:hypothetical protein